MVTAPSIRHRFQSQLEDSEEAAAACAILPSNWNDDHELDGVAGLDSPSFVNSPTAPTPPVNDISTRLATMAALHAVTSPKRATVTAAGNYVVPTDVSLVVAKKTVPAAFQVTLPLSTSLLVEFVTIKDRMLANGAGASTYNITVVPSGTETFDGVASIKIDVDNMALTFRKIRDDAGNVTGEGYELV